MVGKLNYILHITFLIHHNIKTKVKIVTKNKIFDLDPGKLYFINKRVGGKVKLYFTLERKAAVQSIIHLHSTALLRATQILQKESKLLFHNLQI
jgi:hypothetical protein